MNTTTNIDLQTICSRNNVKLNAVVMKDQLAQMNSKQYKHLIVNLQSATSGSGTHWIAITRAPTCMLVFDSFGAIPPMEILRYCKSTALPTMYSNFIIQDINSRACGQYCIAFLHNMQNTLGEPHTRFNDFVNMFDDNAKLNERILKSYYKQNKMKL